MAARAGGRAAARRAGSSRMTAWRIAWVWKSASDSGLLYSGGEEATSVGDGALGPSRAGRLAGGEGEFKPETFLSAEGFLWFVSLSAHLVLCA